VSGFKPRKKLDREALRQYALMLLAQRAMSAGELRQKLRLRAQETDDVEVLLDSLREYGAIDDAKFAEAYAHGRRTHQSFGEQRVFRDLSKKRVPKELAQQAVQTVFAGTDESALIEDYLMRKYRGKDMMAFLAEPKNLASAFRRLRTAGYSAGNSLRVLKKFSTAAVDLSEDDAAYLESGEE
jgi:regulatory protein